jgi:hypothetical protein
MTAGVSEGAPASPPNEPRRLPFLERRYLVGGAAILVVLFLIGVVVHYRSGADRRRYEAALESTLDRLVTAQEGFYYDSTHYTASLRALPSVTVPDGVRIQINNPERRSWWGVATHDRLPSRRCIVWVGTPPAALPAEVRAPENEAKPVCVDDAAAAPRSASRP